jgi:hypothetical protein
MAREKHPQALGKKCAKHNTYFNSEVAGSLKSVSGFAPVEKNQHRIFFYFLFAA